MKRRLKKRKKTLKNKRKMNHRWTNSKKSSKTIWAKRMRMTKRNRLPNQLKNKRKKNLNQRQMKNLRRKRARPLVKPTDSKEEKIRSLRAKIKILRKRN